MLADLRETEKYTSIALKNEFIVSMAFKKAVMVKCSHPAVSTSDFRTQSVLL